MPSTPFSIHHSEASFSQVSLPSYIVRAVRLYNQDEQYAYAPSSWATPLTTPARARIIENQPLPSAQMYLNSYRNPHRRPFDENDERPWSFSLFSSCFDTPRPFFKTLLCPCFMYARNKSDLEALERNERPGRTRREGLGFDMLLHAFLTIVCCAGWILQVSIHYQVHRHLLRTPLSPSSKTGQRINTRRRYNVRGSECGDWYEPHLHFNVLIPS